MLRYVQRMGYDSVERQKVDVLDDEKSVLFSRRCLLFVFDLICVGRRMWPKLASHVF